MWTRVVIWYHIFMMYHHSQNGYLTQNHNHPPHSHCSSQDRLQCTSEPRKKIFEGIIIFFLFISTLFDPSYLYLFLFIFSISLTNLLLSLPHRSLPGLKKKNNWEKSCWSIVEIILKNYAFQIWWNQRINRKWDQKDNPSRMQQHVTRARAPKHVRRVEMYWKKKYERVMNNCLLRGLRKNKEHHDNPSSILSEIKLPPLFF